MVASGLGVEVVARGSVVVDWVAAGQPRPLLPRAGEIPSAQHPNNELQDCVALVVLVEAVGNMSNQRFGK